MGAPESTGSRGDAARLSADTVTSSSPTISLPRGGGAIRGMGEKFSTNPVTGTGSLSVPVYTSPGRSGFGLQLALSYDSGAGNGLFGWSRGSLLPSIESPGTLTLERITPLSSRPLRRQSQPAKYRRCLFFGPSL